MVEAAVLVKLLEKAHLLILDNVPEHNSVRRVVGV
jgi:hypothetical protein